MNSDFSVFCALIFAIFWLIRWRDIDVFDLEAGRAWSVESEEWPQQGLFLPGLQSDRR